MKITVDFNEAEVYHKFDRGVEASQKIIDSSVLKDSNYYCPLDTSSLQKSAILHTVIGSGLVIWQTPYARDQYYSFPNKSKQRNPNASMKWFEVAKSKCLQKWLGLAHGEFTKNFK